MINFEKLRFLTFIGVTTIIASIILISDYLDWLDTAIISYSLTAGIAIVCAYFFADWWVIKRGASGIYKWITYLLFALFLNDVAQIVARWNFVYRHTGYEHLIKSDWWQYRSTPKLVALIYLLSFVLWQRFGGRLLPKIQQTPRLLIVENDVAFSNMMRLSLEDVCTFGIDQAFTAKEAREMFTPGKYSCITIDMHLGQSINDGTDLACALRELDPFVFLAIVTGKLDKEESMGLIDVVDDFIAKPFNLDYIRIKTLLWSVKYRQRLASINKISSAEK